MASKALHPDGKSRLAEPFFGLKDVTESTKVATQDLHIVGRPFKAVE